MYKDMVQIVEKEYYNKNKEIFLGLGMDIDDVNNIAIDLLTKIFKEDVFYVENINNRVIKKIETKISNGKRRWVKRELEGEHDLSSEMKLLQEIYASSVFPASFEEIYGKSNPVEIYSERIKELSAWASDLSYPFISFRYIRNKKRYQIERAVRHDIELVISNFILENQKEIKKEIVSIPNSVRKVPFHVKERGIKIDNNSIEELTLGDIPKSYTVHNYNISNEENIKTALDMEAFDRVFSTEDSVIASIKTKVANVLDENDFNVFMYILSQVADSVYYTGRKTTILLSDIVNNSFKHKSGPSYNQCKTSLYKLGLLRIIKVDKNMRGFVVGLLDSVSIRKSDDGDVVNIAVSDAIMQDLIKKRTISMYGDSLDKLSNSKNKTLAINLQAERMSAYAKEQSSSVFEFPISYFKSIMFLVSKRLDRDIATIESGLKNLKDNKLIIRDFKRKGDVFILDFFPLTEKEKEDLVPKNHDFLTDDSFITENWLSTNVDN